MQGNELYRILSHDIDYDNMDKDDLEALKSSLSYEIEVIEERLAKVGDGSED